MSIAQHDFGSEYVTRLVHVEDVIAGLSDGALHRLSPDLRPISSVMAHSMSVNEIKAVDINTICSAASDSVKVWDLRQSLDRGSTMTVNIHDPITAMDATSDLRLAIGSAMVDTDARVALYDLRKSSKPVLEYQDSHSEDVTVVQFHPINRHGLLSGGVDGLVNVYDTAIVDEDYAVLSTMYHGSVHCAGFGGGKDHHWVYTLSHFETFSMYSLVEPEDETIDDKPIHFGDVRPLWNCEYVCDVVLDPAYAATRGGYIGVGSNSAGVFKILRFPFDSSKEVDLDAVVLHGAHGEEIVRAFCVANGQIYTGGEDGSVRLWAVNPDKGTDKPAKDKKHKKNKRFRPY